MSLFQSHQDVARRILEQRQIESGLFAKPASVTWLSGYARPGYLDYAPFRGGPAMVLFDRGSFVLVVDDQADVSGIDPEIHLNTYVGYDLAALGDAPARLASELGSYWRGSVVPSRGFGIEMDAVPLSLWRALAQAAGGLAPVPLDGMLDEARSRKSSGEVEVLRQHFALLAKGHARASDVVRAGGREIDVWTEVHGAIESAAGRRVGLGYDCVARNQPVNSEGSARGTEIPDGGSLILDLGTHLDGYWTDSCRTYHRGRQPAGQIGAHRAVREALEIGASMVRPGERAGNIARAMRNVISSAGFTPYQHHSGHGIGLTPFEVPYVTDSASDVLWADMVLTLEPGVYLADAAAVRLEDAFLVIPDGAERLTEFEFDDPS
jgi:Xaa-Pro dipeptidase